MMVSNIMYFSSDEHRVIELLNVRHDPNAIYKQSVNTTNISLVRTNSTKDNNAKIPL